MRALAVTSAARSAAAPEVPTLAESGLSGYEISSWFGLFAPAATPPAVIERLYRESAKALQTADGGQPAGGVWRLCEERVREVRKDREGDRDQGGVGEEALGQIRIPGRFSHSAAYATGVQFNSTRFNSMLDSVLSWS